MTHTHRRAASREKVLAPCTRALQAPHNARLHETRHTPPNTGLNQCCAQTIDTTVVVLVTYQIQNCCAPTIQITLVLLPHGGLSVRGNSLQASSYILPQGQNCTSISPCVQHALPTIMRKKSTPCVRKQANARKKRGLNRAVNITTSKGGTGLRTAVPINSLL